MGGMGGFKQTYRCYSVTMLDNREDVERGGKSKFYIKFCAYYIENSEKSFSFWKNQIMICGYF
jgi:hypothetical protein